MRKIYLCTVGLHLRKCGELAAVIGSDCANFQILSKFMVQLPHCIGNTLRSFSRNANGEIVPRQAFHNRERRWFNLLFSPKDCVGLPMAKLNSFCHFRRPKVDTFAV